MDMNEYGLEMLRRGIGSPSFERRPSGRVSGASCGSAPARSGSYWARRSSGWGGACKVSAGHR